MKAKMIKTADVIEDIRKLLELPDEAYRVIEIRLEAGYPVSVTSEFYATKKGETDDTTDL